MNRSSLINRSILSHHNFRLLCSLLLFLFPLPAQLCFPPLMACLMYHVPQSPRDYLPTSAPGSTSLRSATHHHRTSPISIASRVHKTSSTLSGSDALLGHCSYFLSCFPALLSHHSKNQTVLNLKAPPIRAPQDKFYRANKLVSNTRRDSVTLLI